MMSADRRARSTSRERSLLHSFSAIRHGSCHGGGRRGRTKASRDEVSLDGDGRGGRDRARTARSPSKEPPAPAGAPGLGAHGEDIPDPRPKGKQRDGEDMALEAKLDAPWEPVGTPKPPTDEEDEVPKTGRDEGAAAPAVAVEDLPGPPFPQSSADRAIRNKGYRCDYKLGDALRSSSHMILDRTSHSVASLDNCDFAFVKRSDGSFSYAILAYRSVETIAKGGAERTEEWLHFAVNGTGATKKVSRAHWGKYVRLVSMEGLPPQNLPPVCVISCTSQMDDDYSMISNVSEHLRGWKL